MENGQNYSQNCLCNINKFLSVYNLVKVAAWQSSNIGCFYYLVKPVEGSWELNSADRIEVPIRNAHPYLYVAGSKEAEC